MSVILAGVIGKKSGTSYILIVGVALGAVCSGITGVIIYSGAASSGIDVTLYWMMGSVAFAKTDHAVFLFNDCHCHIRFFPPAVADTESDASRKGRDIALGQGPDALLSAVYISQCTFGGMYRDGGGAHRLCRAGGSPFREILYRGRS